MDSVLIRGGRLIDPATHTDARLNLLLRGGKVAWVGTEEPQADRVIDAAGRVVCPGFIDIHMHEDPVGPDGSVDFCIFDCMLRMGVTTAVGGNCGSNVWDPTEYLDLIDRDGAPVHVALYAGHSWARQAAGVTDKYAAATEEQTRRMESLLDKALDAGCVGVSFGLRYVPGTERDEFYRAAARCQSRHRLIASHVRNDAEYIFSAIDEMAGAAQCYDLPLQISHIGSMAGFGQMEQVLRQTDSLRMSGLDVMLDCYPYDAFSTEIGATTYDDGWLDRYACGYEVLEFSSGPWKGQRATEESFRWMRIHDPDALTVCHVMRPAEVDLALAHPSVMIASDGILDHGQGHPRAAGTFPRVLGRSVREGRLSLYEAIRKMTALPAQRLGFPQKGTLRVGADADVVLFDPETVCDRATFTEPLLPPEGIGPVLIGGKIALEKGVIRQNSLGRALRK